MGEAADNLVDALLRIARTLPNPLSRDALEGLECDLRERYGGREFYVRNTPATVPHTSRKRAR